MWLRQWTVKIGLTILFGLISAFVQRFCAKEKLTRYLDRLGGVHYRILSWCLLWFGIIDVNNVFWPHFIFIKAWKYLAPYFTAEDFRVHVRIPLANYAHGHRVTLVTRGTLGYLSYQKGIIQRPLVIDVQQGKPVFQDCVSGCTFTRCKHQNGFRKLHDTLHNRLHNKFRT